ncbi:MAG TPA: hypothetical protein VNO30_35870, partial [Kofleriaceae bacterium]|nr:hypothetical protein [Kofleriaceae bacterium]
REAAPGPSGDELTADVPAPSTLSICCIDYTCPSPDFTTTGCKTGAGPSIREAFDACNDFCSATCASSGLYCE